MEIVQEQQNNNEGLPALVPAAVSLRDLAKKLTLTCPRCLRTTDRAHLRVIFAKEVLGRGQLPACHDLPS